MSERSVDANPTVLEARGAGPAVLLERADGDMAILDGFRVFGRRLAETCIAIDQRASELRQVSAAYATRGLDL